MKRATQKDGKLLDNNYPTPVKYHKKTKTKKQKNPTTVWGTWVAQ